MISNLSGLQSVPFATSLLRRMLLFVAKICCDWHSTTVQAALLTSPFAKSSSMGRVPTSTPCTLPLFRLGTAYSMNQKLSRFVALPLEIVDNCDVEDVPSLVGSDCKAEALCPFINT